jgi:S-adenosylmethionine:tRNA ribosyltransferase-isomerase
MYSLSAYDYHLPQELIAQKPLAQRDFSRLLLLNRKTGDFSHHKFNELAELLLPRDILVVNNTEVIPGRLHGRKDTGGRVEVLILDYAGAQKGQGEFIRNCLIKASKTTRMGKKVFTRSNFYIRADFRTFFMKSAGCRCHHTSTAPRMLMTGCLIKPYMPR